MTVSERSADVQRRRRTREKNRTVAIPPCEDRRRRKRLEADDPAWLRWYFAPESETRNPFTYDFTEQQMIFIEAIATAIRFGGDQAIAATRGEGKTTYFERMVLKYVFCGMLSFPVLFAATGTAAENSIETIKSEIESNVRLLADYPEVCVPVLALENTPNRAHYQIVVGKRHDNGKKFDPTPSRFSWCGSEIILPNVPGSPAAQAIIATRGLDSAVRGLKKRGRRPDLAGIDDPDTEETARSEDQAKKLEQRIDRAIAGLGGQTRRVARVMLTTLQNRICVSYKYTDPAQKPSWKGKRFRFLIKPPDRSDLWEEFVHLKRQDWQQETDHAHEFYLTNRRKMDAGAKVANPNRFNSDIEASALEFYYSEVARIGPEAVATELDNDPPEEAGPVESGITPHRIQRQLNGFERRVIPPGCSKLTCGIDVRKVALHWNVRAWRDDGTGYTIDYGVHEVLGTTYGSDEGLDVAIKRSILAFLDELRGHNYHDADGGEIRSIDRTLIDAGWRTEAVYSACLEAGLGVQPVMGFGKSNGCTQANFTDIQRRTPDKKPGDGWFLSKKGRIWLVCADADRWKAWEHDRWMTAVGKPGCMTLFGTGGEPGGRLSDDEKAHHAYARHICNEVEVEEPVKGRIKRYWKAKSDNTHWLDASYYSDVAANMEGIKLLHGASRVAAATIGGRSQASRVAGQGSAARAAAPSGRMSLSQMKKR
jgi:hypothetical protein